MNNSYHKFIEIDHSLQKQNSKVSLSKIDRQHYDEYFDELKENFIQSMKDASLLFNQLYEECRYVGSRYDHTKIVHPHEFDINIVIKIPKIDYTQFHFKSSKKYPAHVYIKITSEEYRRLECLWIDNPEMYRPMKKWFFRTNNRRFYYFVPHKFRDWMKSVFDRAFNLHSFTDYYNSRILVTKRTSGPAITIDVHDEYRCSQVKFSVDFVPVIAVDDPNLPQTFRDIPSKCRELNKTVVFFVPKPLKRLKNRETFDRYEPLWRLSFYDQENVLLKGKYHLKPALRMLKYVRDVQHFRAVKSYFLKTICLLEVSRDPLNDMWSRAPLSYVFMFLIVSLTSYLKRQEIPYFWNPDYDLLENMSLREINNNFHRLDKLVKRIFNNSQNYVELFEDTHSEM